MMDMFVRSKEYKKAIREYNERVFGNVLSPDEVIVVENEVSLVYSNDNHRSALRTLKVERRSDSSTLSPLLWREEPIESKYTFGWIDFKSIVLVFESTEEAVEIAKIRFDYQ